MVKMNEKYIFILILIVMLQITDEYCNTKRNTALLQLLNGKFSGVVTAAAKGRCWQAQRQQPAPCAGI